MSQPLARLKALARKAWTPALLAYAITAVIAASSFLSTLLLARIAGPAVIGQYALAMLTAHLLASLAVLGLDRTLVREVAGDLRIGRPDRARGVTRTLFRVVALASALVALPYLAIVLATDLSLRIDGDELAMAIAAASVLVWPLQRLGRAALRAVGFPIRSQLLEAFSTVLFMLACAVAVAVGLEVTAPRAVAVMVAGQAIAGLVSIMLVRQIARTWPQPSEPVTRATLTSGLPMMGNLFLQIFGDWLLLALVAADASAAEAGAFRVAIQIITLVTTLVSTTELYIAPRLAGDFRSRRPDLAWARHRRATLLMAAVALPMIAVMLFLPTQLLGVAFGPEFEIASTALVIMAAGQLVVVARGPIGSMLNMSGNDRYQLMLTWAGLALTTGLAFVLIPRYGLTGAAVAQLASTLTRSAIGYLVARKVIPRTAAPS